jgi:hypothetical protein
VDERKAPDDADGSRGSSGHCDGENDNLYDASVREERCGRVTVSPHPIWRGATSFDEWQEKRTASPWPPR